MSVSVRVYTCAYVKYVYVSTRVSERAGTCEREYVYVPVRVSERVRERVSRCVSTRVPCVSSTRVSLRLWKLYSQKISDLPREPRLSKSLTLWTKSFVKSFFIS